MKLGRKILCFLFGCIIGLPLILEIVFNTMDINLDIALKGHFDTYIKPHFELESFISRDYQTDYEKWLNANLKPRGMFIKLYNQIQYSFFDLGNRVIGKEGDIFEESYIDDYLRDKDEYNFSLKNNQIAIEEYVQQLQSIDKRLKEINKHLILYTTPTKLDVSYKNLPYKYKIRQNSNAIRGIDYLKTLLEKTDIIYVDTGELLYDQQQYPSFYKTGIHWSRPLEQKATALIIDMMREISGKEIRNVTLGELQKIMNHFGVIQMYLIY